MENGGTLEPPEGYQGPKTYETSNTVVGILHIFLLVITLRFLFPGSISALLEAIPFGIEDVIRLLAKNRSYAVLTGSIFIATIGVHEFLHWWVGKRLGYDPEFGYKVHWHFEIIPEISPYVVTLNRYITRRHNIVVLGAPLVVLNGLALAGWILPIVPPLFDFISRVVLLTNTVGSTMDIYNIVLVASKEPGTLFLNQEDGGEVRTTFYPPGT